MARPSKKELEAIRKLLQANPDSPLAQLLRESISASKFLPATQVNMQHPTAAMQALVGLLRANTREQMQLAILQLHQSIATHISQPPVPPTVAPSPLLMSPAALSALLTPSGSGFRVDFGAALAAMQGGGGGGGTSGDDPFSDPLDVALSPLPSPPKQPPASAASVTSVTGTKRAAVAPPADAPEAKAGKAGMAPPGLRVQTSGDALRPCKPSGLKMPPSLGQLSIEVAPAGGDGAAGDGGQLSASVLSNAPLSAILSAFGFGAVGADGPLFPPPSAGGSLAGAMLPPPSATSVYGGYGGSGMLFPGPLSPSYPPLSAAPAHTPLFGLSPLSMHHFVGKAASLLEEALDAPLSSQPMSHSRKSPRLFALESPGMLSW